MKKILFFIFTLCFSANFFAQDYTPMLELGKVWNMHHYNSFIQNSSQNYDFDIALDYMQTVNGVEYFHATNGDLLREDITNKKVYKLVNNVEVLLLDFDLNINDELTSPLIVNDPQISTPITTIATGDFYTYSNVKYYQVDCGEKIIEGVGVMETGLFGLSTGCTTVDYDEGNYLINMSTLSTNDYFTKNNVQLYYNKEKNCLQLNNTNNQIDIQIYTTLGKKALSIKTNSSIDVSSLEKGVYYYSLSKNHSLKKGKILIY